MIAIVSDIHGNLDALRAVLADIERQGITDIYCLGDVVGYGPNPCACVDLARSFKVTLLGNHDQAALFDPEGFSGPAERAIFWTRQQLEEVGPRAERAARWEFLAGLPRTHRENGTQFVHGSPRSPLNEYVFPEDVAHGTKLERLFTLVERCCFQGHTHVPGVFESDGQGGVIFLRSEELPQGYRVGARKVMVNVGSVGQPRDGDPRACYVVFDGATIRYRRVEYDIEATIKKMHAIAALDPFLSERLRQGR